jgi:hypothetical protein
MNEEEKAEGVELLLALCLYLVGIISVCIITNLFAEYYNRVI